MAHSNTNPVIEVQDLKKWFPLQGSFLSSLLGKGENRYLKAVDGVNFQIQPGEVLGLAGESGCGKSTTGMTVTKLYEPTAGQIFFQEQEVASIRGREGLKDFRKKVQIVFQNPYESLNPRFTVLRSVEEPLHLLSLSPEERHGRVLQALERSGLIPADYYLNRFPHELSGGQLQRVAIARAVAVEPCFLVADEPTSMLDVSIRAGILNLLNHFAREFHMGILYISHDLSTMKYICSSVAIMYLGRIVEMGTSQQVLEAPRHPYSQALVAAIPLMRSGVQRKRVLLEGAVPNPVDLPPGCRFYPRCPLAEKVCGEIEPELNHHSDGRQVACYLSL
jgi:oligopeptide/dipeptide ABC transporter ATP-binding protein